MSSRPYIISETNWKFVQEASYRIVVLPWGATEAHNYHLPYGTDTYQCDHIAAESARLAWEEGVKIGVLPTIPFGVQTTQLDIPFCINMNPSTQMLVLLDIIRSLEDHGVEKLVILNGHGGNNFRQLIRELQVETGIFLCTLNWYNVVDPVPYFTEPGDHAGELETSVMMHYRPDLVALVSQAGDGAERKFRIEAFRKGWAWAPRKWTAVTADTGIGNPAASTPEKGATFTEAVTRRVGDFFVELDQVNVDEMYETK